MPKVREERTNWRDEMISKKHREWGWDCPAVDVDFLLVEYDRAEPAAIIEYKKYNAAAVNPDHPSMRALSSLGERAGLPFFIVRYCIDEPGNYVTTPANYVATRHLGGTVEFTEEEYVNFLYKLRGRQT